MAAGIEAKSLNLQDRGPSESEIFQTAEGGQSMTREELVELLDDNGYEISDEQPLPNGAGWRFRLASGQIISLFDDGSWNVEGSNPDPIEGLLREYQTGNQ